MIFVKTVVGKMTTFVVKLTVAFDQVREIFTQFIRLLLLAPFLSAYFVYSGFYMSALGLDLKWVALVALVFQNSGLAIAMRYTFVAASTERYLPSTAVLIAEIMKLTISVIACFILDAKMSTKTFFGLMHLDLVVHKGDWFKLCVPSMLYTLQNSLQYYSMSCLSAPVFQVMYQMKIITTAIFSVLMLAKRLSGQQWSSIVALAVGVALVQLSQAGAADGKENSLMGLLSVVFGCCTSGFAGVYFEMVLKSSNVSIWMRNIQLSMIGVFMATISCYMRDLDVIQTKGFLNGYNEFVWMVIILQAAGGLIVAVVVKYADNVLKGFATSLSILISSTVSFYMFHDIDINAGFLFGAVVVLSAVYVYGYTPPAKAVMKSEDEDMGDGRVSPVKSLV